MLRFARPVCVGLGAAGVLAALVGVAAGRVGPATALTIALFAIGVAIVLDAIFDGADQ